MCKKTVGLGHSLNLWCVSEAKGTESVKSIAGENRKSRFSQKSFGCPVVREGKIECGFSSPAALSHFQKQPKQKNDRKPQHSPQLLKIEHNSVRQMKFLSATIKFRSATRLHPVLFSRPDDGTEPGELCLPPPLMTQFRIFDSHDFDSRPAGGPGAGPPQNYKSSTALNVNIEKFHRRIKEYAQTYKRPPEIYYVRQFSHDSQGSVGRQISLHLLLVHIVMISHLVHPFFLHLVGTPFFTC